MGTRRVALLRGVHVGGRRSVPMARLRALAEGLGWTGVASYVQSGNLVFTATGGAGPLERALREALETEFGFDVPVVVVGADRWRKLAGDCPFPAAARERPKLVHLGLAAVRVAAAAAAQLEAFGAAGERAVARDGALWIDFPEGVARSKVATDRIDRAVGAPVTMRNRRTVQAIADLL